MSHVVGVFARADHPLGWGTAGPNPNDPYRGRAHGYVVLFVRCSDQHVLDDVAHHLAMRPFAGLAAHPEQYSAGFLGEWFGGRFDHIATVPDVDMAYGPYQCRGDNRMVAIYDAADVLDQERTT